MGDKKCTSNKGIQVNFKPIMKEPPEEPWSLYFIPSYLFLWTGSNVNPAEYSQWLKLLAVFDDAFYLDKRREQRSLINGWSELIYDITVWTWFCGMNLLQNETFTRHGQEGLRTTWEQSALKVQFITDWNYKCGKVYILSYYTTGPGWQAVNYSKRQIWNTNVLYRNIFGI